ncbi:helix-turn-helix domain-containing protein [Nonomuraea harbinensis]|uniref:Helix-turn-helix domain-containing protein n=1 Tax=Nonomuraea harbinensis TaxID=1286938 RepID=A0ABW1C1E8_9ACTN|nr:helix-turn-helix domain-containing protein [Nonomuraea harbinensis]
MAQTSSSSVDLIDAQDRDPSGQISLRALLAEPLLRGRVIAGTAGLSRSASWCLPLSELGEAGPVSSPDLSGMVVHLPADALAEPDEACALVADLARRDAVALLVWPSPEGRVPDLTRAARAAEEARIPLLVLPAEADYRAVSRLVGQKALAQTSHVLEYGSRVHRTLAEVLARGSGIPAMARAVAGLARCPVLVMDADGETLVCAGFEPGAAGLAAEPARIADLIAERLPDLRESDDCARTLTELNLREGELDDPVRVLIAPIVVGGDLYGRLVLVENVWPPDAHDLAQHRVIAEHGATLTGSEMLRQRSVRAAEEQARGDFVESLVHGRFADPHELEARARHHGFDPEGRYAVHVLTAGALLPAGRRDQRRAGAVTRMVQVVEPSDTQRTLAAAIGPFIVVIRQVTGDALAGQASVAQFAGQLHRALRPHLGDDLRLTHGRAGRGAAGVAASYYEARVAMGLARHTGAAPVCGYDDLRVHAALKDVAASVEGRAFAREILDALRRVHSQTGDLEQVVLAYIRSAGNLNAAARTLKLHRNTMLYKLDRASRALRMDIRSADAQFMVWLAHHIDTLAAVTGALSDELSPPVDSVEAP